ncbi:MAG: glycoside hydrolase family 28 protein [Planctomycetota bacterium]
MTERKGIAMFLLHEACVVCLVGFLLTALAMAQGKTYNVLDYGANADGKTLCTEAIQKAIDACAADGGGTVRVPPGTFLTGALRMKSGVALLLEDGATLLGSQRHDDYYGPEFDDQGRAVEGTRGFRSLIHGDNIENVSIRGKGTIDGSGSAFRDKEKKRPKNVYLVNCRNVLVEDVKLRNAGCWMLHVRFCENVTIRNVDLFNHVSYNNDGLDIDSCHNVTITGCRVDSDDDAVVLKSASDQPCQGVHVSDCTISSHCNALKMGTESGGGFVDITIKNCKVSSPKQSEKIYGRQRGLAGIALEIVDGGRLENVTVDNVEIEGVSVPIFLRLGNRARPYVKGAKEAKPGVGTFRNVRISNITARGVSNIACSITGLPGHFVENVTLTNINLAFEGGGTKEDASRKIEERETAYPESTMFGTLPAYGFFCRHARGLVFTNVQLRTDTPDLRHAMVFDDVQEVTVDGLQAGFSTGGAPMIRMTQVQNAVIRRCLPTSPVDTLLQLEGDSTKAIVLENSDLTKVTTVLAPSPGVPEDALLQKDNKGAKAP